MRSWNRLVLGASAACAAAAPLLPVAAAGLPAPSSFVQCSADGNSGFHATECDIGGSTGVPASSVASAILTPFPFVKAEATCPTNGVFGAGTSSQATYYFSVTGGNVGDPVPLLIEARLDASSTGDASALAKLIVHTGGLGASSPHVEEVCTDDCEAKTFFEAVEIPVLAGSTTDSVTIYAEARASVTGVSNESAMALADPYIVVDPTFPDADLYTVVVSEGVGNIEVPVPEPAKPWLVCTALAALGLARRRSLGVSGT